MPTLRELKAVFIRYELGPNGEDYMHHGDPPDVSITEADAVMFLCPKCYAQNGNSAVGTHQVICNRPRVPQAPNRVGPGRWEFSGTGIDDLVLTAGSSSVLLQGGCGWHGFVGNGGITAGSEA